MLELVLVPNFGPNRKFKIFRPNFTQKGYYPSKAQEANHRIQHVRISFGTKFQLKQTILIFLIICPKRVFPV